MKFTYLVLASLLSFAFVGASGAATVIGATTGQFSTTPSGAATYTIPLSLPEGAGGVAPEVGLTYSSQGSGGILGQGWSVSGSQAITRCPATRAQDGRFDPVDFDSYDRFCLNGSRLTLVGSGSYGAVGAEYRTEIDQYSKIESHDGSTNDPRYFKVWTKSGDILYFGLSNSSVPEYEKTLVWHLARRDDRFDNRIYYKYSQNQNSDGTYSLKLDSITYSENFQRTNGQPAYEIQFVYKDNDDLPKIPIRYSAGVAVRDDAVLERVKIVGNVPYSQVIRQYNFQYQTDNTLGLLYLSSVSECTATYDCYAPTQFEWRPDYTSSVKKTSGLTTYIGEMDGSSYGWIDMNRLKYGDFNGDGLTDIYRVTGDVGDYSGRVHINSGDGNFFSSLEQPGVDYTQDYGDLPASSTSTLNFDPEDSLNYGVSSVRAVDINGDGYADLYKINRNHASGAINDTVYLNDKNGGFLSASAIGAKTSIQAVVPQSNQYNTGNGDLYLEEALDDLGRVMFGEFNGDGFPDVLYVDGHRSTKPVQIYINNSGQGFSDPYLGPSVYVHDISAGTRRDISRVRIVDLNGDGLDDIYIVKGADSSQQDEIYINNGAGGFYAKKLGIGTYVRNHDILGKGDINRVRLADFNGDGYPDVYRVEGINGSQVDSIYLNDGLGNFSTSRKMHGPSTYVAGTDTDNRRYTLSINRIKNVDYNADGLMDVYFVRGDYSTLKDQIWLNRGDGTWSAVYGPSTFVDGSSRNALSKTIFDVARLVIADFTGDGLPDVYRINGRKSTTTDELHVQIGNRLRAIERITTGLGEELVVEYGYLTEPGLYTRGCQLAADDIDTFDVIGAMSVVKSNYRLLADGSKIGETSYTYGGLCADRTGRGSLGFETTVTKNDITGITERVVRHQDFPLTGLVLSKRVERSNAEPLLTQEYEYRVAGGTYLYYQNMVENSYELGSAHSPYKARREIKSWGTSASDYKYGHLKYSINYYFSSGASLTSTSSTYDRIDNTYFGIGSDWKLGRLATTKVTKVSNGLSSIRQSSFTYNAQGSIATETIEPNEVYALTKSYTYDGFGNVLTETLADANQTTRSTLKTYSTDGRFLLSERNALGHQVTYVYNDRTGFLLSSTDSNGLTTQWETNEFGRVTQVTAPDGTVTSTEWLSCDSGNCIGTDAQFQVHTTVGSLVVQYPNASSATLSEAYEEFDRHERTVATRTKQFAGRWSASTVDYDRLGRVVSQSAPFFVGSSGAKYYATTTYDELGRVTKQVSPVDDQDPTGTVTQTTYDGLRSTVTDTFGRQRTAVSNARGEIIQAIDPMGHSVYHLRDGYGLILTTTDAASNQTTFEYDKRGLKIRMDDPSMGSWTYEYNAFGELVSQTDANLMTTTNTYDVLGRKIASQSPGYVYQWIYDGNGKDGTLTRSVVATVSPDTDLGVPLPVPIGVSLSPELRDLVRTAGQVVTGAIVTEYTYDTLMRPQTTTRYVDDQTLQLKNEYDLHGRLYRRYFPKKTSILNDGNAFDYITYFYDASSGAVKEITYGSTNRKVWKLRAVDARGNPTSYDQGDFDVVRYYDVATGRLRSILTDEPGLGNVQSLQYDWNAVGNLSARIDHNQNGLTEYFQYDDLDRLTSSTLFNVSGEAEAGVNTSVTYDLMGNITSKSGVGTYSYFPEKPFAVSTIVGERPNQFAYDLNGSLVASAGLTVAWTPFRKPVMIQRQSLPSTNVVTETSECVQELDVPPIDTNIHISPAVEDPCVAESISTLVFGYDANNNRAVQRELSASDVTEISTTNTSGLSLTWGAIDGITTYYMGGGDFERRVEGVQESNTFHVRVAGILVGTVGTGDITSRTGIRHIFTDHLGSVDVVASSNGDIHEKVSFDAFGRRRAPLDWQNDSLDLFAYEHHFVKRGFTGHEQLDTVGLVHMNGRIYDPTIGRFLSADPQVQFPQENQSYNRYSYVMNNPMRFTDPSGYGIFDSIEAELGRFESSFRGELRDPSSGLSVVLNAVVYIGSVYGCNAWAAACIGAGTALISRGQGASDEDAALAGAVAAVSYSIGNSSLYGTSGYAAAGRIVTVGAISGSYAAYQGGDFGRAFAASVVSAASGQAIGRSGVNPWAGTLASAVVGGTVSEITGGKFVNGAVTAAFAYAISYSNAARRANRDYQAGKMDGDMSITERKAIRNVERARASFRRFLVKSEYSELLDQFDNADIHFVSGRQPRDGGAYVYARAFIKDQLIEVYAAGVLQDYPDLVELIGHEFRHLQPANDAMFTSVDAFQPWQHRPGETDATNWSRRVICQGRGGAGC